MKSGKFAWLQSFAGSILFRGSGVSVACRMAGFSMLLLGLGTSAWAQAGRGSVSGTITDPSGALVPGADVKLVATATGVTQDATSGGSGLYNFVSLNPGQYEVDVRHSGFATVVRKDVVVTVDQTTVVNVSLRLGNTQQVVNVTQTTSLLEPSNSTVGQLISAATIDRVPLLNRDVYDLTQLSPGVTPSNGSPNSSNSAATVNIASGRPGIDVSSYTFNGAIVGSVYYMVDGAPVGVAENNAASVMPGLMIPEDDVEEERMETQNTPASYQSGGAGVISLVTKSGGDRFHGDIFGDFRPDVMAANDYFNKQNQISSGSSNVPPTFHRYQEGGSFGGPILHKKLFFFADYEDTQQQLFDGSNTFTVPTSAERIGNFSADTFTIYDPLLPDNANGNRQPFYNNVISNPNPIALKFLSEMPRCNVPSPATCDQATNGALDNLYVPGTDPTEWHKFDVRMDWDKSERQHIFGRLSWDDLYNSLVNAFNNAWDPFYAQNVTHEWNVLLADDYTINSTTALQLRYSFLRHFENQTGDPGQSSVDNLAALGFVSPTAADEVYKTLPYVLFSDVGGGVGGTADEDTFVFASENSDASATLTRMIGKNELSAGFEYMERFLNVGQPPEPSGAYYFDESATDQSVANGGGGSDFASFLVGMGEAPGNERANFSKDLFAAEANRYYAAFLQDNYHPSQRLSITAGLRWDVFGGRTERFNRLEDFDPTASNTVSGVSYQGAEVFMNGSNRSPFSTNMGNVAPRLGFALELLKNLVVSGGAGLYYGPSPEMVASATEDSDGYSSVTNWNATCYNADGNTEYNGTSGCVGAAAGAPAPSFTGIYSLTNPFPNGVVPTISSPSGYGNELGTTLNTVLRSEKTPTTYDFNLGFEWQMPHEVVLRMAYVGSRGLFVPFFSIDLNTLSLATIQQYGASLCVNTASPSCQMVNNTWQAIQPGTNANYGSSTVPLWVSLQKYPQFGNGSYGSGNGVNLGGYPGGDSEYSSLQVKVQKRLSHHVTTQSSFTWGKLMTDDSQVPLSFVGNHLGVPQDTQDLQYEHSVSPQDVKYEFVGSASYDLPVGRNRAADLGRAGNAILGEWTINGIVYLSDGNPIASPVVGAPTSYFNQRPNLTCNPASSAPHSATTWFNPNCFVIPTSPFLPGNAPAYLDHVRAQGARELDLSLYKNFSMGGARKLRFEFSCYNVTNTPQFAQPSVPSIYDVETQPAVAATFGLITSDVNTPRQFQFGSRFQF